MPIVQGTGPAPALDRRELSGLHLFSQKPLTARFHNNSLTFNPSAVDCCEMQFGASK